MVWTYLAASEESQKHSKTGCSPSHIVKSTPTLKPFSCLECRQVNFLQPQSGTMCQHCQQMNCPESTLSTVDSPAKTSQLQVLVKAWRESEADYSTRSCDSLMYLDHHSSSWKMSQQSLLGDLEKLPKKLPKEAMIQDGVLYPLLKLEPHTKEKDGGFLPTPVSSDATVGNVISKDDIYKTTKNGTLRKYNRHGTNGSIGLARYVQFYPTPTARDYKDNGNSPAELARNSKTLATHAGGQLNPQWVEWLMGYPQGWTELKDWAMQWFQSARKQRSKSS